MEKDIDPEIVPENAVVVWVKPAKKFDHDGCMKVMFIMMLTIPAFIMLVIFCTKSLYEGMKFVVDWVGFINKDAWTISISAVIAAIEFLLLLLVILVWFGKHYARNCRNCFSTECSEDSDTQGDCCAV